MLSSAHRIPLLVAAIALAACDGSAGPTAVPNSRADQPVGALSGVDGAERIVEESLYDMSGSSLAKEVAIGVIYAATTAAAFVTTIYWVSLLD